MSPFHPDVLLQASQALDALAIETCLHALDTSRGATYSEHLEAGPALLLAAAEWMRRVIAREGAPGAREEKAFLNLLRDLEDEPIAPWVAVTVFQHFPASSLFRAIADRFDARLAPPMAALLTHNPALRTRPVETWLAQIAPELSVPDYGFDARGEQTLPFGTRTLTLRLTAGNAILLEDGQGKRLRSIPRARKADDPKAIERAREHVKNVKNGVKSTTRKLVARFQDAMILERTWTAPEFTELFLTHPLLQPLGRSIVFEHLDSEGPRTFFISEEGEPLDLDLEALELQHPIRIAAPASLDRETWRELFEDAEITQPFPQLDRAEPTLPEAHPLADLEELKLQARSLCVGLHQARFTFDRPDRRRRVYAASKHYGTRYQITIAHSGHYENIWALRESDTLRIESIEARERNEVLPVIRLPTPLLREIRRLVLLGQA